MGTGMGFLTGRGSDEREREGACVLRSTAACGCGNESATVRERWRTAGVPGGWLGSEFRLQRVPGGRCRADALGGLGPDLFVFFYLTNKPTNAVLFRVPACRGF